MEEILEALQREETDWAQLQIKVHITSSVGN